MPGAAWLLAVAPDLAHGLLVTLELTLAAALLGGAAAVAVAAGRRSRARMARGACAAYVEMIRNTPFIVQLFFVFFGLPGLGVRLDALTAAVLAMAVNLSAYAAEILRAGLDSVGPGQREAAVALGLRRPVIFARVVLPQALRAVFPALASQLVITMLESAVVSQIAVRDLTYEADLIQSRSFLPFRTYILVTALYLAASVAVRRLLWRFGPRQVPG